MVYVVVADEEERVLPNVTVDHYCESNSVWVMPAQCSHVKFNSAHFINPVISHSYSFPHFPIITYIISMYSLKLSIKSYSNHKWQKHLPVCCICIPLHHCLCYFNVPSSVWRISSILTDIITQANWSNRTKIFKRQKSTESQFTLLPMSFQSILSSLKNKFLHELIMQVNQGKNLWQMALTKRWLFY